MYMAIIYQQYLDRQFHQFLDILTQRKHDGTYPEGTVNDLVYKKLRYYAETAARYKE